MEPTLSEASDSDHQMALQVLCKIRAKFTQHCVYLQVHGSLSISEHGTVKHWSLFTLSTGSYESVPPFSQVTWIKIMNLSPTPLFFSQEDSKWSLFMSTWKGLYKSCHSILNQPLSELLILTIWWRCKLVIRSELNSPNTASIYRCMGSLSSASTLLLSVEVCLHYQLVFMSLSLPFLKRLQSNSWTCPSHLIVFAMKIPKLQNHQTFS